MGQHQLRTDGVLPGVRRAATRLSGLGSHAEIVSKRLREALGANLLLEDEKTYGRRQRTRLAARQVVFKDVTERFLEPRRARRRMSLVLARKMARELLAKARAEGEGER